MVVYTLQPAARSADSISALAGRLKGAVDTRRRGGTADPAGILDQLLTEARAMKKELR